MTLTFRRPDDLAAALPTLVDAVQATPGAELLVIDNDTVPSARATVEEWSQAHPVRNVHEPRPGIAAARNRGLAEAAASDVVVFIDDDERPGDGWLDALVATYRRFECVGVAGRVVSEFTGPLDPWLVAGGWFDRLDHPTGTVVPVVATNNLLLDMSSVRSWSLRFDEEFGLTGGSDTVFALEAGRRGGTFVWCSEAAVVDVVPAARATRRWVVRRALRSGNSGARAQVHVTHGRERLAARATFAAKGLARLVAGSARAAFGTVTRNLGARSRGTRTAARGAGMLLGAVGYVHSEYARR
ncbi:glycosyltransferase [Actinotalea sp. M2MS4P-6]|uniref:glycosyltransferase family 2 protein n=1 Tax=Actinotalea sp. M2MS4P-6 TaxID=2983762 RepID=UPI0021E4EC20|nr:glycosyltransferase [Actinotalea sp. M2MS4P-6]MCV2396352.1 glycosyltransferase [Actinotalea sp. M2MS4P-6]